MNSAVVIEKLEEEIIPQDAPTKGLQEENGRVLDEVTKVTKAKTLPLVNTTWTKGLDGVSS